MSCMPATEKVPYLRRFVLFGATATQWARVSIFTRFIDHNDASQSVDSSGRVTSPSQKDVCLTKHKTHERQTSRHPVGFELTISAGERPKTYASDGAATGTGNEDVNSPKFRYTTVGQSANDSHQSSLFLTHPTAIPATGHHVAGLKQT